jgi:hypothetical protein
MPVATADDLAGNALFDTVTATSPSRRLVQLRTEFRRTSRSAPSFGKADRARRAGAAPAGRVATPAARTIRLVTVEILYCPV